MPTVGTETDPQSGKAQEFQPREAWSVAEAMEALWVAVQALTARVAALEAQKERQA